MSNYEYKPSYKRNLPHIQPPGATFFVTFNLVESIPKHVFEHWKKESTQLQNKKLWISKRQDKELLADIERRIHNQNREWFRRFEKTLDAANSGPLWLKEDRIARLIAESLCYRDERMYSLDAYCIMANHVHVVFTPLPIQPIEGEQSKGLHYHTLSSILQSLKGYTARKANQILGRSGAFWHRESYDHCVRNMDKWHRIVFYVLNNPVKAGLVDNWEQWEWSYLRNEDSAI